MHRGFFVAGAFVICAALLRSSDWAVLPRTREVQIKGRARYKVKAEADMGCEPWRRF